jgi:hypothetical protein
MSEVHPAIRAWREIKTSWECRLSFLDEVEEAGDALAAALESTTADRDELARQVERLDYKVCEQAAALEASEAALREAEARAERYRKDITRGIREEIARDALERR